ncbi:PRC-barrel domain-containing protein [Nitrosococcus wardiae]|uniref:EF-hand domain-containing protein n=1 Tax=Nitrosococcus wardiae TaxID=1814290 RepID=A0A4P7BZP3_9GAMM|nr:PRC-barrel domain-containing protein [Nitrosococcus wardiae]QBQ55713.1 hypothetical protein E3U44_15245 [Nitrosococcus wardiae]
MDKNIIKGIHHVKFTFLPAANLLRRAIVMSRPTLHKGRLYKVIFISASTFLLVLSGTAQSVNQDPQQQSMESAQETEAQRQNAEQGRQLLYKMSVLRDREVQSPEGEQLGRISELVVDKSGQVKYAVLSHGGTLGIGEKMTAVPWDALQISKQGEYYTLNVTKEQLADAPTFSEENWPTNAQWTPSSAGGTSPQATFAKLDQDQSGDISKDEAEQARELSANFDEVDQNEDGKIDRSEFSAFEVTRQYHGEGQANELQ